MPCAPPTLMRRTPRSPATCSDGPAAPTSRLTGLGLADKWVPPFEKYRALAWGLRLLAAAERELTDRTLYMEFEPRHFCKQIDIASADGTATKAHVVRRQVERLDHAADTLQDQRVCDRAVFPRDPPKSRGDRDQDLRRT